jgi:hypothetical protein
VLADEAGCGSVVLLDQGWEVHGYQLAVAYDRLSVDVVVIDVDGSDEDHCGDRVVERS